MGVRLGFALAVGVAWGSGCAGHLASSHPAANRSWRQVESAHFQLRTDEAGEDAQATLAALEFFRAGLLAVFHAPEGLETGRIPVILVESDWTHIADRALEGFHTHVLFQPLIVLRGGSSLAGQETIKHEFVHDLSRKIIPHQPLWLAEGLASYFQTADHDLAEGSLTVGRPPNGLLRIAQTEARVPVEELFARRAVGTNGGAFYATAWALVHFLVNHHAMGFRAYQQALAQGQSHDDAWGTSFPDLPDEALDGALRTYLDGGQYDLLTYPMPLQMAGPTRERPLGEADQHETRAILLLTGYGVSKSRSLRSWDEGAVRAEARQQLDLALASEPLHAPSLALLHFELGAPLDQRVELTKARDPGDWLAAVLWVEWLGQNRRVRDQRQAIQDVGALVRKEPSVELELAWVPTSNAR